MNPNDVAPMVMAVVLFVVAGGVLVLRPLSKRLGNYLDMLVEERRRSGEPRQIGPDAERLATLLDAMDSRLSRLEERQAFTDALLARKDRESLPESGTQR